MPTENNARNMVCPFKMGNPSPANGCDASACMAWQWSGIQPPRRAFGAPNAIAMLEAEAGPRPEHCPPSYEFVPCDEDTACWVEPESEYWPRLLGYCRLIGKE